MTLIPVLIAALLILAAGGIYWNMRQRGSVLSTVVRSGIASAKARGKCLGRQLGQRPKSDRLAPKVLALVEQGRSYRLVGRELGLSKNTVWDIVKRNRAAPENG